MGVTFNMKWKSRSVHMHFFLEMNVSNTLKTPDEIEDK
jgi:hypothetical protein